jgi:PAS domain S-box-containing protein
MGIENSTVSESSELRKQAKNILQERHIDNRDSSKLTFDEVQRLSHEFRIHKIELEIQNEELRRTQLELQSARDKYSDLYDNAPVGYFVINKKGKILEVNLTGAILVGVERGGLIEQPITKFITRENQDDFYIFYQNLLETKNPKTCELELVKNDGSQFHGQLECIAVQDKDDNSINIRMTLSDISQRKQAERALKKSNTELEAQVKERTRELEIKVDEAEQANRLKGDFLANMSHELRTPLNSIMMLSSVLISKKEKRVSDTGIEYLEVIGRNGRKLFELIDDILNISWIESGQVKIQNSSFSLGTVVVEIMEGIIPVAEERGLSVDCEIAPDLPMMNSDIKLVYCILQNLLSNAVKFTDIGELRILVGCTGNNFHVSVEDTGIGISQDDLPHIFDKFRQVDGSLTKRFKGVGLGLALVKQIAKLLDGNIQVESELGKGTVFTVTLPVGNPVIVEAPNITTNEMFQSQAEEQEARAKIDRTVLIIEDIPDNMLAARAVLGGRYRILEAVNGEQGLEKAFSERPDLIILDIALPGMSGFEVVKRIKADPMMSSMPVIALTAHAMKGDREKILKAGCDEYVSKPLDKEDLLLKINKYLGK